MKVPTAASGGVFATNKNPDRHNMAFQYRFTFRFYLGIVLIVFSLVLGGVTKVLFIVYFHSQLMRWMSVVLYALSWPILILGAYWAGRESYDAIHKYAGYRYYHEHLKRHTRRAYHKTRELKERVKGKLAERRARKLSS